MRYTLLISLVYITFSAAAQLDSMVASEKRAEEKTIIHDHHQSAYFKGGDKKLNEHIIANIKYPQQALESKIEGKVIVQFVVEKDGTVSNVKSIGSKIWGHGIEEEAIRIVKLSNGLWVPSYSLGEIGKKLLPFANFI